MCRVLAFDPPRHTCTTNIIIIIAANQAMSVLLSVLNNIPTFIATASTRPEKTVIAGLQGFYNVVCKIQTASFRGITRLADKVFSIFTDVSLPGIPSYDVFFAAVAEAIRFHSVWLVLEFEA
jgi:hypothetical protein